MDILLRVCVFVYSTGRNYSSESWTRDTKGTVLKANENKFANCSSIKFITVLNVS